MKKNSLPLIFLFAMACPVVFSQTNYSASINGGLIRAKDNYGRVFSGHFEYELKNNLVIGAGYSYAELDRGKKAPFDIHKYSLTIGNNSNCSGCDIYSFFKIGPDLLFFRGIDYKDKAEVGVELSSGFYSKIVGGLSSGLSSEVNFNTSGSHFLSFFINLRYDFSRKKEKL